MDQLVNWMFWLLAADLAVMGWLFYKLITMED